MKPYILNLELGMPPVEFARKKLHQGLRTARASGCRVVKVIHGYGSSGKGGAIRADALKVLAEKKRLGQIRAFVPGEDFSVFSSDTRTMLELCPELRHDLDLTRQNHGITMVLL